MQRVIVGSASSCEASVRSNKQIEFGQSKEKEKYVFHARPTSRSLTSVVAPRLLPAESQTAPELTLSYNC
jgi:hypothetical protein